MKLNRKHIVHIVCWSVLVLCFIGMYIAGRQDRKAIKCNRLEVCITDSLSNKFVGKAEIKTILDTLYGKYLGVSIDSLDLSRIEQLVDSNSAVNKAQAFVTRDGALRIDVTQRKPVVRFITKDGGYYADTEGRIFPLQKNFSSRVHVVDGLLPVPSKMEEAVKMTDPKAVKWFKGVIELVNYMNGSDQWKDKIVQIHSKEDGSLILIPREGNEQFLFGQPENIAGKFDRIAVYYTTIIPEKGKDCYKSVNVEFEGQIVCK